METTLRNLQPNAVSFEPTVRCSYHRNLTQRQYKLQSERVAATAQGKPEQDPLLQLPTNPALRVFVLIEMWS